MKRNPVLTIAILLLALCSGGAVHAQSLVIWQKDGSKVSYELDDQPRTTFTTDDLVITTTTATISFPLTRIQRYTYEGGGLNISDVKTGGIIISHNGDVIIVKGLAKGKSVVVYSVDGKQLLTKQSDGTEPQTLTLSKFPTGVYMIKAESITYKFLKK